MFRLTPVEALLERSARRKNERDRTLVARPWRARRLYVRSFAAFVGWLALWAFFAWNSDGPNHGWQEVVYTAASIALGGYIGTTALNGITRAVAYRSGWLDGRAAMVEGMRDSRSPEEWLRREMHRDLNVLGVPPDDWPAL